MFFFCPFHGKNWESCLIAIHAVTPRSNLSKTPQISKSFGFRPLCSEAGHLDISAQSGSLSIVHPAHHSRRDARASLRFAICIASQVDTSPIRHPPSPGHQAILAQIGSPAVVESTHHLLNQDRSPLLVQATPRAASWHQHHHPSAEGCSHPSKQAS